MIRYSWLFGEVNRVLAHQIICMDCGYQGSFDTQEVSIENTRQDCFKYFKHNPFTSAMHYQCPECNSYLKVDPMDIFKMYPVKGHPHPGRPGKDTNSISVDTNFLWQLPGMIKDGVRGLKRYITKNIGLNS